MKILNKSLLMAAASLAFAACASAPCPTTESAPQTAEPQTSSQESPNKEAQTQATESPATPSQATPCPTTQVQSTEPPAKASSETKPQNTEPTKEAAPTKKQETAPDTNDQVIFDSQTLDLYRLNTPENIPTANDEPVPSPIEQTVPVAAESVDPYKAFPALAASVFTHADSLYKQGFTDSASTYLQRFRIIKPLWITWEAQADSMLNEFGKTRAEKAKAFEPLVLQIKNMNRAQAAYSMVAETADSLIALAPGDSLTQWAQQQKDIAHKNTLAKATKEYRSIKSLADDQAQFAEAKKKALELQMRYRDFENELKIEALIAHIDELIAVNDEQAAKYWESHDPAEALAKADALIKESKYNAARDILNKLKSSKLRKEANAKYSELANTFCNAQRKTTSQIFAKAQKQKDAAKKKKFLQDAIAPLEKCLTEYPDNPQKDKVLDNKRFLEKELAK